MRIMHPDDVAERIREETDLYLAEYYPDGAPGSDDDVTATFLLFGVEKNVARNLVGALIGNRESLTLTESKIDGELYVDYTEQG